MLLLTLGLEIFLANAIVPANAIVLAASSVTVVIIAPGVLSATVIGIPLARVYEITIDGDDAPHLLILPLLNLLHGDHAHVLPHVL